MRAPESVWAPVLTLAAEYQDQPDGHLEVRRPRNLAAAVNFNDGCWGANLTVD